MVVSLALALALVAVILIAAVLTLGIAVFGVVRRQLQELLVQLTTKEQSATRLLRELVEAEEALRPVAVAVAERMAERRTETDAGREAVVVDLPGGQIAPAFPVSQQGVAPTPAWIRQGIAEREKEAAEAAAEERRIAAQDTDAVVGQRHPWDSDETQDGEAFEQAITPARDSKLAAGPPG